MDGLTTMGDDFDDAGGIAGRWLLPEQQHLAGSSASARSSVGPVGPVGLHEGPVKSVDRDLMGVANFPLDQLGAMLDTLAVDRLVSLETQVCSLPLLPRLLRTTPCVSR